MIRKKGINKPPGLLHVDLFNQVAVEEGIINI
jgi:hypothetical protein